MIFNSVAFLLFFSIAFGMYWALPKKYQNAVALLASLFFYGWADWRFLGLVLASVTLTWGVARLCDGKGSSPRLRRIVFLAAVVALVATLCFFKYFNFFVGCFSDFSLKLILPLGISFYTFMCIGYLADVYNGKVEAERNWCTCALFLMFFPQVAAGPIGRAGEMLPQYRQPRAFDYPLAVDGCRQFLWGLFKKVVIADGCATLVDRIFLGYQGYAGSTLALGAFMYAVQIYGDFSGYTDMAIGVGKLFGIRLRKNFAYPYFAANIADFWRRWHMSLTTWFRDYVYIPLGGSRCWFGRVVFNTWVVFLLSGLWHGAAWTFVIWGAVHAALLTALLCWKRIGMKVPAFVGWLVTMVGVVLAWVFFRAPTFGEACGYLRRLFSPSLFTMPRQYLSMLPWIAFLLAMEWLQRKREHGLCLPFRFRAVNWAVYAFFAVVCIAYQQRVGKFIYFQF